MSSRVCVLAAVAAVAMGERAATGDPAQAAELRSQAVALRDTGEVAAACALFTTSARVAPVPEVAAEVAACREAEGDVTEAVRMYELAASGAARPESTLRWRDAVARLRAAAGAVTLDFGDLARDGWFEVAIDGRSIEHRGRDSVTVLLPPGDYRLRVTRPACRSWDKSVKVLAGRAAAVLVPSISCIDDSAGKYDDNNRRAHAERWGQSARARAQREREDARRSHPAGPVLLFGGLGTVFVAGALQYESSRLDAIAESRGCPQLAGCGHPDDRAVLERSSRFGTAARVAFAVGVGAAVAGWIVVRRTRGNQRRSAAVGAVPAHGGVVVGLGGTF